MRNRADGLVLAQFLLLALLLLPGAPLWSTWWTTSVAVVLAVSGLILAGAGIAVLGRDLVPWVAPRDDAPLRTTGVFRLTRNPIYLGILLATAGWVLWRATIPLIVVWMLLAVVLAIKAHVEQRFLLEAFGDAYRRYAESTPLMLWGRGIR